MSEFLGFLVSRFIRFSSFPDSRFAARVGILVFHAHLPQNL